MPRSIGTPRDAINRSGGSIGNGNGLSTRLPIGGGRTVGSSITDLPAPAPMPQSEINRINDLIRRNASQYLDTQFNRPIIDNPPIDGGNGVALPRNPFEVLADALQRSFGGSVYNPPLTQQSYGYGSTSGVNWTLLIIIGAVGIGAYFYFNR